MITVARVGLVRLLSAIALMSSKTFSLHKSDFSMREPSPIFDCRNCDSHLVYIDWANNFANRFVVVDG